MTETETPQWQVRLNSPTRSKVLFRGVEADARDFVERNFPRRHIEPNEDYGDDGAPHDVVLHAPDGGKHVYEHTVGWTAKSEPTAAATAGNDDHGEDD